MKKKIIIGLLILVTVLMASAVTYAVTSGMMGGKSVPLIIKSGYRMMLR